jgi:Fibronectin type III domain
LLAPPGLIPNRLDVPGFLSPGLWGVFALKIVKLACVVLLGMFLVGCNNTDDPTDADGDVAAALPTGSGTATLSWDAPTTTTEGMALTNLAGYRIYYGTERTDLTQTVQLSNVATQTYVIDDLGSGTWYFAVRAVTSTGVESALSDIVSKTIS